MKFSITIPAYKKKFLSEAIESCLAQSYRDFELIIVDDASPEGLDTIVHSYEDSRIRYYKNEKNCGAVNVVDNWNKCLEYTKGDYIICMGDDDKLLPNCLEEYETLIKKYPGLGVYHAWTQIIDEKGCFANITAARPEYESVYSLIWHRWDNRKQQFIGDFLFDANLLKKNGGYFKLPLAWASDDISAVIAAKSKGIANTQSVCFCYRVNSQTISNIGSCKIKLESIEKEEEWFSVFLKERPNDLLDRMYWTCIKDTFRKHFEKKRGLTIAHDIKKRSIIGLLFWYNKKRKYKLTNKILIYSTFQAIKSWVS